MNDTFSEADLEAYLDEALPADEMARVEAAARAEPELARRLAAINARRDAGSHSLGGIWRRQRLSCPSRSQLGSYLLGVLSEEEARFVKLHIEVVGCRWCQASAADLSNQQAETAEVVASRRRKYFQSSAGYLKRKA